MAKKSSSDLVDLLRRMWLIRAFEEKASALYAERQIVGLLHLSIGQEAVAVGVCSLLSKDDLVYGGHRSHGHAIAKGADINRLMAEIAGRATGYCGGKGGSMHIVAKEAGFITATGVVGGTIPLALGAAFAAKEKRQGQSRWFFSATAPVKPDRFTNRSTSPAFGSCRLSSSARTMATPSSRRYRRTPKSNA